MGSAHKLLLEGESEIETVRTHVKVLFGPFLLGLVTMLVAGFVIGAVGNAGGGVARLVVLGLALVLLLIVLVIPFLRWITWSYTLTTKRLIEQRGILTRTGRIIPLARVNDVAFEKDLIDRILGCGTLIIHDASQQEGLRLRDIPRIQSFHRAVSQLVLQSHQPEARRDELH